MANIFSQLKGIPIDYLVATPLMAAARSNHALAQVMVEYIMDIAFEEGADGAGDGSGTTRVLTFTLERQVQNPETLAFEVQSIKVTAPLLGLVPIPALLVDNVTIDFTADVSQSNKTDASVTASVDARYGFGAFSVSGNVSTTVSNTRSTDYSAKYTFHVQADQQPPTEGMSKLMDVMASVMTPIPASTSTS